MLARVLDEVVESGVPDLAFCICWANESWTKTWVGGEKDILIKQTYSDEDDLAHIRYLIPIFRDSRYIRVNGRPLFVLYNIDSVGQRLPRMLDNWQRELEKEGFEPLYICNARHPPPAGIEASINFFPNFNLIPFTLADRIKYGYLRKVSASFKHTVVDYEKLARHIMNTEYPEHRMYHCPVPSWDNTPRRAELGALILNNASPEVFGEWVRFAMNDTIERFAGEERLVFINAWNEWAEGTHLEPDLLWGHRFLEEVRKGSEDNANQ
jgi:hypothetical protein